MLGDIGPCAENEHELIYITCKIIKNRKWLFNFLGFYLRLLNYKSIKQYIS